MGKGDFLGAVAQKLQAPLSCTYLEAVHTLERVFAFLRLPFSLSPAFPPGRVGCVCGCVGAFCVCATLDTDSIILCAVKPETNSSGRAARGV